MRVKFVVLLFLAAGLVLGAAFLLKHPRGDNASSTPASPVPTALPAPLEANRAVTVAPPPEPAPRSPAPPPTNAWAALAPAQREAAIDAEIDRLDEWSAKNDSASLSNILADLAHPEREVREAAITAAEQFGSSNAIPALKAAAANAQTVEEQMAFLEAAEFLSLPRLSISGGPPSSTQEQKKAAANQAKEMINNQPQATDGQSRRAGANQ